MGPVISAKPLKLREFLWYLAMGLAVLAATLPTDAAIAVDTPLPAATSPNYLIGPGDSLHVFVFQNEELSVTVPVRPDGKVSTPLVEDMVAVGKTPSQLARDIESISVPMLNFSPVFSDDDLAEIVRIGGPVRQRIPARYQNMGAFPAGLNNCVPVMVTASV